MTVAFAVYDPATGAILRTGWCHAADVPAQAGEGEGWLILDGGPVDDATHRVDPEAGTLVALPPAPATTPSIADLRAAAIEALNTHVAATRRRYITDLPGQDGIYLAKEAEASAWLSAGKPADLTGYPLIAAEAGITAPTPWELVQLWLNLGALWRQAAAAIEHVRQTAYLAVATAANETDIAQAVAIAAAALA